MGWLCGCGFIAVALLAGAFVLRLAVSLTNRLVGPTAEKVQRRGRVPEWDWDDWDDEDTQYIVQPRERAIPEPGLATCAAVMFVTAFAAVLGFVLLSFAAESVGLRMRRDDTQLAVAIVDLPIVFLTLTVTLVATLPTTFWRGAMIAFVYGFLLFVLVVCIGIALFFLRVVLG